MRRNALIAIAAALALAGTTPAAQSGRARNSKPPAPKPAQTPTAPDGPKKPERRKPGPVDVQYDTKYVAGSLEFKKDSKTHLVVKDGVITFTSEEKTFQIPVEKVTELSYGQHVRSRWAEGAGVGVLVPVAGGIIGRTKSKAHYIEILWDEPPFGGADLRVDKKEYAEIIAALETATGVECAIEGKPGPQDW